VEGSANSFTFINDLLRFALFPDGTEVESGGLSMAPPPFDASGHGDNIDRTGGARAYSRATCHTVPIIGSGPPLGNQESQGSLERVPQPARSICGSGIGRVRSRTLRAE
jgi:hypothetical protein